MTMLAGAIKSAKPKDPESIWSAVAALGTWIKDATGPGRGYKTREGVAEVLGALGRNREAMKVWGGTTVRGMLRGWD